MLDELDRKQDHDIYERVNIDYDEDMSRIEVEFKIEIFICYF
jgi:hypothetical protein